MDKNSPVFVVAKYTVGCAVLPFFVVIIAIFKAIEIAEKIALKVKVAR